LPTGIVDRYSEDKGFGYIMQDGGKLVLFERGSIAVKGYKAMTPGDRVSFEIEKSNQGPIAKNIKKL
jgi:CspA family cold shock protein